MSGKASRALALLAVASLAMPAAACGPRRYAYAPVTVTSAETSPRAAAEYAFPPDSPQGNVRLATIGIAEDAAEYARSIHVRMVVTNHSQPPWVVDKAEQRLAVAVGSGQRATMIQASAPATLAGHVDVLPGESATIDLLFPLPAGARDASDVPAFDALWTVRAGGRPFTLRTPFERFLASSPAQSVPSTGYPYSSGRREPLPSTDDRLPGTPDARWPARSPSLVPDAIPRPTVP